MAIPDLVNSMPSRTGIGAFPGNLPGMNTRGTAGDGNETDGPSFSETLKGFVDDVNTMQKDSAKQSERFLKGEAVDVHDVMIAAEKAKTTFQLLMELRNKALDVYKEALRVQV
ncbi:MAG: flagellar hook-basal body complex protein FliE [Candidatus Kapaibacterium sp.]